MDAVVAQVDVAISDARRAAIPGAIGEALDRSGAIVSASIPGMVSRTSPSASPLSVAIDGPGMFAFEVDGKRLYGRLGDFSVDSRGALVDGRGRSVLGVVEPSTGADLKRLAPIRIDLSRHYSDYSIDDRGVLSALADGKRETLGRLALAVFPASERMARADETSVVATPAAGLPRFYAPGDANVGVLHPHALENGLVDLEGDLARVWGLRRRGELAAAQARASDECVRDALGLVK